MVLQTNTIGYKTISQLLTYIQGGNVTTTTVALICLNEVLTQDDSDLQALVDGKAVKLLLNIVESKLLCVRRAQFAALRCLSKLCENKTLQKEIMTLRGVHLLFECLNDDDFELMLTAIYMISDLSSYPAAWDAAHECGGIQKLINILNASQIKISLTINSSKSEKTQLKLQAAQYAAKSLSMLCNKEENRKTATLSNIISVCHFWVKSKHQNVIIPILLLLQQLSISNGFRKRVNDSRMIMYVLHHLRSTNMEVKQAASDLILIFAGDHETFKNLHRQEFVSEIFQMMCNKSFHENEVLMTSISGILWKCSKTNSCIRQLETLTPMPVFTQLLENQPVQVKAYIVGTIGMCMKSSTLREMIRKTGGIEIMVNFLQTTHIPLIINLNEALAKGSEDTEILVQYLRLDAVQLIWSCLKNSDFHVQSSAASALCTILKNMKKANLQLENSLDGIECIIDLLTSKHKELLTPACTLIHNLAKDKSALSVLVEFNVASHLMRLMKTNDKKLLQQLCLAVASCCSFRKSCEKFASCGITRSLLKNLKSKNKNLRVTAASALSHIAAMPNWCSVESQNKIIPILTEMLLDPKYKEGNESAAMIMRHILCTRKKKKSNSLIEPK